SKSSRKPSPARHDLPTASYVVFADYAAAADHIRSQPLPLVIKADGLAAGKGVFIAQSMEEALAAARDMLQEQCLGDSGARLVVESFLQGEEASFIALVDGRNILPLASSRDHKAEHDVVSGRNAGGMGAYSPRPGVTDTVIERVMADIMRRTVDGRGADGRPFTGVLYAGLMIDAHGMPHVLEYNVRFGDPETQPILMRLESDLVPLLEAALTGQLDRVQAQWRSQAALGVVMAAAGYPGRYAKGDPIHGIDAATDDGVHVFHAGTRMEDGQTVTSGGRVLCACAQGDSVTAA